MYEGHIYTQVTVWFRCCMIQSCYVEKIKKGDIYAQIVEQDGLSKDTYTSVIEVVELEICTKTLQNFGEKLSEKFPLSTFCLSMVRISCLVNAFLEKKPGIRPKPKPKTQNFDLCTAWAKKSLNMILVKGKDAFCVSKAILSDLKLF